jgi:serine/threonine protein kinase
MNFPKSIEKRCVIYDVFNEVHACTLDTLKSQPAIVDIYDYGVDSNGYHIVMKRYSYSLKEWRLLQKKSLKDNLSLYLSLYKDILLGVELLHSNNITHYDIKADNIFLDVADSKKDVQISSSTNMTIALGDMGEWKVFISDKDEFCEKNRGTEVIMSPEMFMLAVNIRKDTEKYDRRKRMGTNRLSDIWSLGWLFYELLTGQILFKPDELYRLCPDVDEVISKQKYELLDNNVYLIDFLSFMLVKDPRLRPSISSVIKRFEHVHALLVVTGPPNFRFGINKPYMTETTLVQSLEESISMLNLEHDKRINLKQFDKFNKNVSQIYLNSITPINESICYCSKHYLKSKKTFSHLNITHIISMTSKGKLLINHPGQLFLKFET